MRKILFFGILLLSAILLTGCVQERQTDKVGVIVSILPQAQFVERVGGDKVEVTVMVPPGASPHVYEPTPNQLVKVGKAKLYAKVGSPLEFELIWLDKIIGVNKEMLIVDCSDNITLIGKDPHIWLSPKNAEIMVENIYLGLVRVDPVNQEYYALNKDKYLNELKLLDKEIEETLSGKNGMKFMVYHPSWAYFARDYGLEQVPIEVSGKEPTALGIENLIKQAKEYDISVIFASPQFSTESAEVIAKEIGGSVALVSSLEKDYLMNMGVISVALAETMSG